MNVPYPTDDDKNSLPYPQNEAQNMPAPPMVNKPTENVQPTVWSVKQETNSFSLKSSGPNLPPPPVAPVQHATAVVPPPLSTSSSSEMIDWVFGNNTKCLVKQKLEQWEMLTGYETENAYSLKFGNGIRGFAKEKSNAAYRVFLDSSRPFKLKIVVFHPENNTPIHLMTIKRPYKFIGGEIEVRDDKKQVIGTVKHRIALTCRKFVILDTNGREIFNAKANHVFGKCFNIYDPRRDRKTEVGSIRKKWSGLLQEMYSDADNFGVELPAYATPKEKALLLAATFLIDFMYFEDNQFSKRR